MDCPSNLAVCPKGTFRYYLAGAPILIVFILAVVFSIRIVRVMNERKKRNTSVHGEPPSQQAHQLPGIGSAPPTVVFHDVRLSVKGVTILDGISGTFPAGAVTAVMGPSGSGKSSLVNVLTGKVRATSGSIMYGSQDIGSLGSGFRKWLGYVPQDDVLTASLTVEQTLMHSARLRCPPSFTAADRAAAVEATLAALNLTHVRHSLVGDAMVRGISGGEKRRVSVGVELISGPKILVLDEPTTGLDSVAAEDLVQLLHNIAATGISVLAIIHQPSALIFNGLDNLVLLGKGGKAVFVGPAGRALRTVERGSGLKCPSRVNPADWIMDVLSGALPGITSEVLTDAWANRKAEDGPPPQPALASGQAGSEAGFDRKPFPNIAAQTLAYARRNLELMYATSDILFVDICLHVLVSLFVTIGFVGIDLYQPPLPSNYLPFCPPSVRVDFCIVPFANELQRFGVYHVMALGLTAVVIATRTFSSEFPIYFREASWGVSTLAYFLGRCISEIPVVLLGPIVYVLTFCFVVAPVLDISKFLGLCILLELTVFGVGHVTSMIISPKQAALAGVVFALLAGLGVTNNGPAYLNWGRWFGEASYSLIMRKDYYASAPDVLKSVEFFQSEYFFSYALQDGIYRKCCLILILFIAVLNTAAFIILSIRHRDKKK